MRFGFAKTGAVLVAISAFAAMTPAASAQEMRLRIADSFPSGHYVVEYGTKPWMEDVKRLTDGKVAFDYFPAEQLGKAKDMFSLAQSGVADIAYVAPAFVTDKLSLATVAELPGAFESSCKGTSAYWKIAKPGGILDQRETAPAGMRVLWALALPPYQLYMAKEIIASANAAQAKKIRTTGAAKDVVVRKLGGAPVQIPSVDVMEALSRGTVDGMLLSHSSVTSYDLAHTIKSATLGENLGSFVVTYMIGKRKWNQLPADVKAAMEQAGEKVAAEACVKTDAEDARDIERSTKAGVTFVNLPPAEKAKIQSMAAEVSAEWAAGLDKRRLAGGEVLNAFREALNSQH